LSGIRGIAVDWPMDVLGSLGSCPVFKMIIVQSFAKVLDGGSSQRVGVLHVEAAVATKLEEICFDGVVGRPVDRMKDDHHFLRKVTWLDAEGSFVVVGVVGVFVVAENGHGG